MTSKTYIFLETQVKIVICLVQRNIRNLKETSLSKFFLFFFIKQLCRYFPILHKYILGSHRFWSKSWLGVLYLFQHYLTLSTLGKTFSRQHFEMFFLIFPRKQNLTFHANCLHWKQNLTFHANCLCWRQFAWNVKFCFLGNIRKILSIFHLLN